MNYLSPKKAEASIGALDESAPKKVSLYPNLGSRKAGRTANKPARLSSYYNAYENMITAAQLRAARGLLDWTRADLAKAANISPETVKNIEHGTFKPQENTAEAIIQAFKARDVEFTENEGVKKVSNSIAVLDGYEGFKNFMDDLYQTALSPYSLNGSKPICVCNVDNELFKRHLKEHAAHHIERMTKIEGD